MSLTTLFFTHLTEILAVGVVILGMCWFWIQRNYSYWKRYNMPYIKPHPIFGNIKDLVTFQENPAYHFQKLYNDKATANAPAVGLFILNKPCLLIRDIELAKCVLVKDFNKFTNRFTSSDPHSDIMGSENLFFAKNPRWRHIRQKLTPVFTSGKIKQMFPLVEEIGIELDKHLSSLSFDAKTNSTQQEVKEINALFTTDVIASVAFGVRANSISNPNGDFRRNGKRLFHFTLRRAFEFLTSAFWPHLVRLFRVKIFSPESEKFLRESITHIMDERIKSGRKRNDLIDTLIEFKQSADADAKDPNAFALTGDGLIAQAAIFFSAGFETTSATMSFALYELSNQLELQKRLREEIRQTLLKNNGRLTYDLVQEMPYMQQVLQEVLRLYPPLPFLDRECTLAKDEEAYSLRPHCDFAIPNGMPVFIPIYAMQRDPKYYPNPDTFDPERFSPANKHNVNPYMYMPFGTGPRNCIGERFGLLQAKVGIINFLRNHYVTPCEKSHPKMKLAQRAFIIQSEGGIFCNIVRDPLL